MSKTKYDYQKFIEDIKKHPQYENFDYSLITEDWWQENFKNKVNTKLPIICKKHGVFHQNIYNHLKLKKGCFKCSCERNRQTRKEFLKKAKEVHGDKYDYSLITEEWWEKNYTNVNKTLLPIICPKHGVFYRTRGDHIIVGNNCPWCTSKLHYIDFIEKAKEVHENKYKYPFNEEWWLKNFTSQEKTKIPIICPKHGIFYKSISNHLKLESGCPKCSESKGEKRIRKFLEKNNINYFQQYQIKIKDRKKPMYFDFFLPDYNFAIEFDGWFHYHDHYGTKLEKTQERDKIKNNYCKENNIDILRIPYWETQNIEKILKNKLNLKEDL